jgi:transcription termination/antitermination protein NusA
LKNDFLIAINQVCAERRLPKEVILDAIEQALVLAYKRNFGPGLNIEVKVDPNTGRARVFADKEITDTITDDKTQITLADARQLDAMAKVGGIVRTEMTPRDFGRITAQTAKQVILQRIREAERETIFADWADRSGELVLGTVRNIDSSGNAVLSLGRAEATMPKSEMIPTEQYSPGQRVRTYIYQVERSARGPHILVSRTHQKMLRRLLESEVPEIYSGAVEIKAIAREAGSRSKVGVAAVQAGIDPVGSCVGMRGVRIQNIVNELSGEKIDVVAWAPDEAQFVANSLSPAKVEQVWLSKDTKTATVVVPDNQLSLAIGKEGQNARLAAKLTGWRIDIKSAAEAAEEAKRRAEEAALRAVREAELAAKREAALALLAEAERALAAEEAAMAETSVEQSPQPMAQVATEAVPGSDTEPVAEQAAEVEVPVAQEAAVAPAPAAAGEVASVPAAGAAPAEAPDYQPEPEEEEGDAESATKGKGKKKRRGDALIFDEETGTVVRRTTRKESRVRWEDDLEPY